MSKRSIPVAALLLAGCLASEPGHRIPEMSPHDTGVFKSNAARQAFAKCPGAAALAKAVDLSWSPQTSHLPEHRALRDHLKVPLPEGSSRILFWSSGTHHTSVAFSVVAVRDNRGRWHTTGTGEEGPGLIAIPPRLYAILDRELSLEESQALDQSLADRCLYASPTFQRDPSIVAGGAGQTLEIETPDHHWISSWFGVRTPQQDAVINLIAK